MGLDALEYALTYSELDEDFLADVQRQLAALGDRQWHDSAKLALQNTYANFKSDADNLPDQWRSVVFGNRSKIYNLLPAHHFRRNQFLTRYCEMQKDLVQVLGTTPQDLRDTLERMEKSISQWGSNQWLRLVQPNGFGNIMAAKISHSVSQLLLSRIKLDAHLKALSLMVAIRRFELRYKRLPAELKEAEVLLSEELPSDPFANDHFRWSKAMGQLYSLGENGLDDGGSDHSNVAPAGLLTLGMRLIPEDIIYDYLWSVKAKEARSKKYSSRGDQDEVRRSSKKSK